MLPNLVKDTFVWYISKIFLLIQFFWNVLIDSLYGITLHMELEKIFKKINNYHDLWESYDRPLSIILYVVSIRIYVVSL